MASSTVIGTITDSRQAPLDGAEVRLVVSGTHVGTARTGDDGRFFLTGEMNGRTKLQVRRIGFRSREVELYFPRDTSRVLIIILDPGPAQLSGVEAIDREDTADWLSEFNARRKSNSVGYYFTGREILSKQARYLSEVLRSLPGVNLGPSRRDGFVLRVRGCRAAPLVWVNRGRVPEAELDEVARIHDVAAMEVYLSMAGVPAQYLDRSNSGCGTILIWTRQE